MEELGEETLEGAQTELEYEQERRSKCLNKPKTLQELDLRTSKLKRLIQLLSENLIGQGISDPKIF
jgi:hypothetical protein